MTKAFTSNAILIVSLNLVVKSIYLFGIDRGVQNALPEGQYGLYFTLFNFAFLLQVIADFGLHNFNARHLAQSRHLLSKYFPDILLLKLSLGTIFLLVLAVAGWCWGFKAHAWWLLLGIGINQVLQTLVLLLRSNLAGLGLYRIDSWASILDKSLLIFIVGYLLWWPSESSGTFQLHWFILAHTAAYLITIGLLLSYLQPHLKGIRIRWHWGRILSFLRASAPFGLVVFLMTAYTRLDAIMLEKLRVDGLIQADRYASAFRLLDASNVGGVLLAGLLLPMFVRLLTTKQPIDGLVRLAISAIWSGAITLAISVFFFANPIMQLLYVNATAESATVVQWLMLTFIPMSGTYVYGTILTANGSLRPMNIIFSISIFVNLLLNYFLIPQYGATGAAAATFATQSAAFVAQLYLATRLLPLNWAWWLIIRFAILAAVLASLGWYLSSSANASNWVVNFSLLILSGGVLAFLLRLLHPKDWLARLSTKE